MNPIYVMRVSHSIQQLVDKVFEDKFMMTNQVSLTPTIYFGFKNFYKRVMNFNAGHSEKHMIIWISGCLGEGPLHRYPTLLKYIKTYVSGKGDLKEAEFYLRGDISRKRKIKDWDLEYYESETESNDQH